MGASSSALPGVAAYVAGAAPLQSRTVWAQGDELRRDGVC